jgi:hypothetical protein
MPDGTWYPWEEIHRSPEEELEELHGLPESLGRDESRPNGLNRTRPFLHWLGVLIRWPKVLGGRRKA